MSPRARYRATTPAEAPQAAARPKRWRKRSISLVLLLGYAALMWYVVFPWVDRTFVNQPAL